MAGRKHTQHVEDDLELQLQVAKDVLHLGLRKAALFGLALLVNIAFIIPFLAGHSLHAYADRIGKYLIFLAMCLSTLFFLCIGQAIFFWVDVHDIRKFQRMR